MYHKIVHMNIISYLKEHLPQLVSSNNSYHRRPLQQQEPNRSSSSSNWILMSRQPHRITSGQSNSGHKQIHTSKLFSHIRINPLSSQSTKPITPQTQNIHTQISDTNFQRASPLNITPAKKAHKARTCWYHQPFCPTYRHQVKQ